MAAIALTAAQLGVWYASRLDPENPGFNAAQCVELTGSVDVDALVAAIERTVSETEAVRVRFADGPAGVRQTVMGHGSPVAVVDLRADATPRETAREWMRGDLATASDVTGDDLCLSAVFLVGDAVLWYLRAHHLLLDGVGFRLVTERVAAHYSSVAVEPFPPLDELVAAEAVHRDADRDFWLRHMGDLPDVATLSGRSVPMSNMFLRSARDVSVVDEGWPVAVVAATALYVSRVSGSAEVVLGFPVAARVARATRNVPGMVTNVLPLRLTVRQDMTLGALLDHVSAEMGRALRHQRYRIEDMRRDLNLVGDDRRLYGPVVNIMPFDLDELDFAGVRVRSEQLSTGPVEDIKISVHPSGSGLRVYVDANPAAYDGDAVAGHAERLIGVLATLVEASPDALVGRIDVRASDERVAAGPVEVVPAEQTLPEIFEQRVREYPSAVAVTCEGVELTYRELNSRANRVAHDLIARGVGPEDLVAVMMPRSIDLVVALLGVVKAGAAYLPVDPSYPQARIDYLLENARPRHVITEVVGGGQGLDPVVTRHPEHPAYVIYTSGSTGQPKGVVVPHSNVVRLFTETDHWFGFGPGDAWTLFHSFAFDFSVWEIWGPLLHGGKLVVVPHDVSRSPADFLDLLARERVTVLNQTPSAFYQLIEADREQPGRELSLRYVVFGGEALDLARLRDWYDLHADDAPRLVNMYGITETTVHVSFRALTAEDAVPGAASAIGVGIPDLRVHVLDQALQPVPPGVAGELYVSGAGLARGYLGQQALTAHRFVADPFGAPGTRMYRTGDVARLREDGSLDYLGRADHQVKIRGFRVELGEIEAAVATHPGVAHTVVLLREDRPGHRMLVAYVVPNGETAVNTVVLRRHVSELVPEHLVPGAFVVLDSLPLTPNGKLDRRALPAPVLDGGRTGSDDQRETVLCGLVAEVLGVAHVGVDDNFFVLGGDSLLADKFARLVRAELGAELTVTQVFDSPTVAGMAVLLDSAPGARPPLQSGSRPEMIPLSPAQRRLWFLSTLDGPSPTYTIPIGLRLPGAVDAEALRAALADVAERHEILRTTFPDVDGVPHQHIGMTPPSLFVEHVGDDVIAAFKEAARKPFDLAVDPPLRAHLFVIDENDHMLLLAMHHIAGDGWSLAPLGRDLATAYTARCSGDAPQWTPLPVQYADYALWQRELLAENDPNGPAAEQASYWTDALAELPEGLELPTDRQRPAVTSYTGGTIPLEIESELHHALLDVARTHRVTLFMVLQAALAVLLTRMGAGTDIPIGSPVAGRTDAATADLVGCFINTLVLRTDTSGDPSFAELLHRVRTTDLEAFAHQDIPFENLVDLISPERSLSRQPLFQVMLVLQNNDRAFADMNGVVGELAPVHVGVAKFDLTVELTERPGGISGYLEYSDDLFEPSTAAMIARRLLDVLAAVARAPQRPISFIELLDPAERSTLLSRWTATTDVPDAGIASLFERQALLTPDAVAVTSGSQFLTYRELNARANGLARTLSRRGVRGETGVAVLLDRSPELVIALLAVLKTGAFFVPLNPRYSVDRMRSMIIETGCRVVITDRADHGLDAVAVSPVSEVDGADLGVEVHPEQLAYVMHTSGSTGVPKGVAITQRDVVSLAFDRAFRGDAHRVVLLHSPHSFDASTYELWVPLLNGGRIVVAPEGETDAELLADLIRGSGVTGLWLTSGLFNLMAEEHASCFAGVREVWTGGDVVSPASVNRVLAACPQLTVVNGYGPTETTTFATSRRTSSPVDTRVPIGRPLDNMRAYVLDELLRPVPVGVTGELYVAGAGLARGYLGRGDLTAERFVADPFSSGSRMYRTGDLVRWTAHDELEFVGRADNQVKLRGFRIEPGEIEARLAELPDVAQAAVIVREDRPGDKRLVAYVVGTASVASLLAHLKTVLPDYMVPSAIVVMDRLPLTTNGKLDRRALPVPEVTTTARAARTDTERVLAGLFCEVLGLAEVGVDDGFFELGGDSIMSVQLVSRARKAGFVITPRDVFEHRTVAAIAAAVWTDVPVEVVEDDPTGSVPLTPIMHWLRERGGPIRNFNQTVRVDVVGGFERQIAALQAVMDRHDMLRATYTGDGLQVPGPGAVDARSVLRVARMDVAAEAMAARERLDPEHGVMVQAVFFPVESQLLLVIHHLVVDGVSWRVLLPDLAAGADLPPVPTSFRRYSRHLTEEASQRTAELPLWQDICRPDARISDPLDPERDTAGTAGHLTLELAEEITTPLLTTVPTAFHGGVNDALLTAFALAVADWRRRRGNGDDSAVLFDLEGHGREDDLDLSGTVGWFTTMHPVRLDLAGVDRRDAFTGGAAMGDAVKKVKEQLRAVPDKGIGYGLLRYLHAAPELKTMAPPQFAFNYLGRFAEVESDALGDGADPAMPLAHVVELNAVTRGERLHATWSWPTALLSEVDAEDLARTWFRALEALVKHVDAGSAGGYTPSDLPLVSLSQEQIDLLEAAWRVST